LVQMGKEWERAVRGRRRQKRRTASVASSCQQLSSLGQSFS
jgi:hypothetical protein